MKSYDQDRTSFSSELRAVYSLPASFAAWATFSLFVLEACFFCIQSVKYNCQADGANAGGRRVDFWAIEMISFELMSQIK